MAASELLQIGITDAARKIRARELSMREWAIGGRAPTVRSLTLALSHEEKGNLHLHFG